MKNLYFLAISIITLSSALKTVVGVPLEGRDYEISAYQVEGDEVDVIFCSKQKIQFYYRGDTLTIVLKIKANGIGAGGKDDLVSNPRKGRQDEDDDDDTPATTPYIPQILPGISKIFNGILTGNLNEIFHGSTSFAPKEVSHSIDTVYNQVVGIAPPTTTVRTTTGSPLAAAAANETVSAAGASADASTKATPDDDDDEAENEFINPDIAYKKKSTIQ